MKDLPRITNWKTEFLDFHVGELVPNGSLQDTGSYEKCKGSEESMCI